MIRLFIAISFIFAGQMSQAQTIQQMSNTVNQLTNSHGDDLEQADRRAIKRRLEVILEIYEDAGFNVNKNQFLCSGRTIYTKDGNRVIATTDSEQCQFNIAMTKKGSSFFCSGRTNYNLDGSRLVATTDRSQCEENLEYSSRGSKFLCSGRTFYNGKGNRIVATTDRTQCKTNLDAVAGGSERICSGRTLYDLEGNRILATSSRDECEQQILF